MSKIVLAPILIATFLAPPQAAAATPPAPWRHVFGWIRDQRDQMARDLETAHAALLARAEAAGAQDLVARLAEPPGPRPSGYGILPEIAQDGPERPVQPRERLYSLERLGIEHAANFRDAAVLAGRATAEADLPLEPWVAQFERLRKRMRNLEDHLDYHAKWQVAVVEHGEFFAARNHMVELMRQIEALQAKGGPAENVAELRAHVLKQIAPFRPTPGLAVERHSDGSRVLAVTVHTDIDDEAFLDAFRDAVAGSFSRSEAARSRRFSVDLHWTRISPDRLYPEGAPAHGAKIDMKAHRERFPTGSLVLTTGAESTHAWTGKGVLLGPSPLSPRNLAHEFAHLLGFEDTYLRGYDGDPRGQFGAVLVEWVGLKHDLMGNPGGGLVTEKMIDTLLGAYDATAG